MINATPGISIGEECLRILAGWTPPSQTEYAIKEPGVGVYVVIPKMVARGLTASEIASRLKVARQNIYYHARKAGYQTYVQLKNNRKAKSAALKKG